VSTVAEIKEAVARLPARQKIQIARWMQTQISDRLSEDEMMAIAEGREQKSGRNWNPLCAIRCAVH